jgi:hypothetical protein
MCKGDTHFEESKGFRRLFYVLFVNSFPSCSGSYSIFEPTTVAPTVFQADKDPMMPPSKKSRKNAATDPDQEDHHIKEVHEGALVIHSQLNVVQEKTT